MVHNRCCFLYRTINFNDLNRIFQNKFKDAEKSKRGAGLNMRRKKFKPIESLIKNCEDGDQIMLKEGNVKKITLKIHHQKKK